MARSGWKLIDKSVNQLQVGDKTTPKRSGRYRSVSVGRDDDGYYVFTHRARSESYESLVKIPDKEVRWIRSTG